MVILQCPLKKKKPWREEFSIFDSRKDELSCENATSGPIFPVLIPNCSLANFTNVKFSHRLTNSITGEFPF